MSYENIEVRVEGGQVGIITLNRPKALNALSLAMVRALAAAGFHWTFIDTEHGVIVDVEATPAHRTAEVESTKTMIDRTGQCFDLKPKRLVASRSGSSATGASGRSRKTWPR